MEKNFKVSALAIGTGDKRRGVSFWAVAAGRGHFYINNKIT